MACTPGTSRCWPRRTFVVRTFRWSWSRSAHPVSVLRQVVMLLTGLDERIALLRQAGADQVGSDRLHPRFRTAHPAGVRRAGAAAPSSGADRGGGELPIRASGVRQRPNPARVGCWTLRGRGSSVGAVRRRRDVFDGDPSGSGQWRRRARSEAPRSSVQIQRRGLSHGDHRGRELGFPTANLPVPSMLLASSRTACTRVGSTGSDGLGAHGDPLLAGEESGRNGPPPSRSAPTRPSTASQRRVESYMLDRSDLELYGAPVAVDFITRIRG